MQNKVLTVMYCVHYFIKTWDTEVWDNIRKALKLRLITTQQ